MSSSPDHVLTNSNHSHLIDHVFAHDSADNFSDYLSLHFVLKFSNYLLLPLNTPVSEHNSQTYSHSRSRASATSSVDWHKINQNNISCYQDHLISSTIPDFPLDILNCCVPNCVSHHSDLDVYSEQLFNCITTAADLCFFNNYVH